MVRVGVSVPRPCLRLLASTQELCSPGCCEVPESSIFQCLLLPQEELSSGTETSPRDATTLGSSLHKRPWLGGHWRSCHGSDLKDRTWQTHHVQGAGVWGPQGTAQAAQGPAQRGLRPLQGWDELTASCLGLFIGLPFILLLFLLPCGDAMRGEGWRLLRPRCLDGKGCCQLPWD